MQHYSDEEWVDFARELLPQEKSVAMLAHLEAGCKDCSALHRLWTNVTEVTRDESRYTADDSAVASVKRMFAARQWGTVHEDEGGVWNLVFDSLWGNPAPAGVRSISTMARHLLYQSSRFAVDVRIDSISQSSVSIAGQILAADADASASSRWQVTLLRSSMTVGQTLTNDHGEFYFESETGPDLRIRIDTAEQPPFALVLPD